MDFCLPTEGGITARYIPIYETALPGVVFDESLVAISAFGGLIAVARHPNRWAAAAVPDEPAVRIFTPAGDCQAEWRLDDDTLAVAQLAWTHAEKLVVLSTSGAGHVLDVNATVLSRFSLWSVGVSATVSGMAAAGSAVAIVSKPGADLAGFARRDAAAGADDPGDLYGDDDDAHAAAGDCVWIMPDVEKPALRWALPLHPHTPATAEALALLPAHLSDTGEPEVLVGLSTASLLRMSAPWHAPAVSHVRQLNAVPQAVRWAPSGQHIALFLENGMVDVFTDGFDQHILRADSGAKARGLQQPDSFEWAGDQTIAVAWLEVAVDMVSLQGQVAHCLEGVEAGLLGAELDGVRVVGHDGYGLLQLTPPAILSTLSLGETSPAADLCDALEALDDDGDAEETVETLVSEQLMTQAVTACVATALHATLPDTQKRLLSAAAFGKAWDPAFDAPAFTAAAKTLRVLNTLRQPAVAMPLTWPQWRALGVETVVDRLLARRQHALALRLVEFQPLPSLRSRVLEHWAIERVITAAGTVPDEELVALICDQLRKVAAMPPVPWALRDGVEGGDGAPGLDDAAGALSDAAGLLPVRFADVAAAADAAGHRHLATVLLEQEKRPAQQVPLLLKLRQHDRALKKAVQSKDPNLVHMTVLHLQRAIPREELISLLARFPMAARLAAHFSEFQDPAFAEDLYEAWGQHLFWARSAHRAAYDIGYAEATGGDVSAAQVLRSNRLMGSPLPAGAARTVVPALLGEAADRLRAGERPNGKALGFYAGAVDRHRALIAAQEQLDAAGILPESSLAGLPLHSTLVLLVSAGADREASKLRSAQDVDDAVWHRLRVRGYVVGELWGALKSAAGKGKTRSFPVPPQYVVRVLAENGHSDRAATYAELIPDQEERIDTLMQLGKWGAAADLAAAAEDPDRLAIIAQKASTPAVQQQAAAALSSLQG